MSDSPLTFDDITLARERVAAVALVTPILSSASFSHLAGQEVWLKAENLQRTGSFKIRGATNALALLTSEERAGGVVAASAGNHTQGVALAAHELGVTSTVFMPASASIPKITATRGYGADVRLEGNELGDAVDAALAFAAHTGARFIHPYDDPTIIAGQGTLELELIEQMPDVGTAVFPIGGGGLIAGSALAIKSKAPNVRVVGVQTEAVPAYAASRKAGKPVIVDVVPTVADGIAVGRPSELAFEMIERDVDDIVTVSDDAATGAVALLLERAKFLVEPSGAVTVAAVLSGLVDGPGPVVTVLSGGNIDLLLLDILLRHGLEIQGRFASGSCSPTNPANSPASSRPSPKRGPTCCRPITTGREPGFRSAWSKSVFRSPRAAKTTGRSCTPRSGTRASTCRSLEKSRVWTLDSGLWTLDSGLWTLIIDSHECQAVWRRGSPRGPTVARGEDAGDGFDGDLRSSHVDADSDHRSDHLVAERRGGNPVVEQLRIQPGPVGSYHSSGRTGISRPTA